MSTFPKFTSALVAVFFLLSGARAEDYQTEGVVKGLPVFAPQVIARTTHPLAWNPAAFPDFAVWRQRARDKVLACLLTPPTAAPWDMTVLAEEDRGSYTARKLVFNLTGDSRVLAYMTIPKGAGPFPAVLLFHDHGAKFDIGKEKVIRPFGVAPEKVESALKWVEQNYSGRFLGDELAKRGYVCFATDALNWSDRGGGGYDGQQKLASNLLHLGMSQAGLMAWEDMRETEFLAQQPSVDPHRIAAMGWSMGAFRAWQAAALSDHIAAAVADCWMNTTAQLMTPGNNQTTGNSAYNMVHPGLLDSLDFPDIASIACPKPMMFFNGRQDKLFPVAGVESAYAQMHRVWSAQGADDRLVTKLWDTGHTFNAAMQDEAFAWLDQMMPKAAPAVTPAGSESSVGWEPDPKALEALAASGKTWRYEEKDIPKYELPDPLALADGSRVATAQEWEQSKRPQTLELFRRLVYGRSPGKPEQICFEVFETVADAVAGRATLKRIRITVTDNGKSFSFPMALLLPNDVAGPVPAFVLINTRPVGRADPTRKTIDPFWPAEELIGRGYAAAVFQADDVDLDKPGEASRANGVRAVWNGPGKAGEDAWATLSAWAWGASRVLDYLQTDAAIDPAKIAIIGHSRGGKASLWAGAQDERFALVISNNSGHGGASLSRPRFGETVAVINRSYPYWFCGNFATFSDREDDLPIDQHQLISLIAPRAVYVASADHDFWSDQRSEFLSLAKAGPVYGLYGYSTLEADAMPPLETPLFRDRMAYHIRRGAHGMLAYDWERYMDFADHLWRQDNRASQ